MVRAQSLHFQDGSVQVALQLPDYDPPAGLRPESQPFLAALVNFQRPGEIVADEVQIDNSRLQDAAIKLADRACFGAPGCFEGLMSFPIMPVIEEFQTLDRFWMERSDAIR